MSTLSRESTWYTQMNSAFPDSSTADLAGKSWMWLIKEMLCSGTQGVTGSEGAPPTGSLWTVVASCDSTTAGHDNIDRWTDVFTSSKLIAQTAGSAHSWTVLKSPDALGPVYMCLDYSNGSTYTDANIYISPSQFVSGTTLNRPTSSKEVRFFEGGSSAVFSHTATTGFPITTYMNMTRRADGAFYTSVARAGNGRFDNMFGVVPLTGTVRTNDVASRAVILGAFNHSSPGILVNQFGDQNQGYSSCRRYDDLASIRCDIIDLRSGASYFRSVGTENSQSPDGTIDAIPIYVATYSGGTFLRGVLPDAFFCAMFSPGSMVPATGTYKFCIHKSILLPFSVVPTL